VLVLVGNRKIVAFTNAFALDVNTNCRCVKINSRRVSVNYTPAIDFHIDEDVFRTYVNVSRARVKDVCMGARDVCARVKDIVRDVKVIVINVIVVVSRVSSIVVGVKSFRRRVTESGVPHVYAALVRRFYRRLGLLSFSSSLLSTTRALFFINED
jgi:hypothetical protein